jgi:hypothetical protein
VSYSSAIIRVLFFSTFGKEALPAALRLPVDSLGYGLREIDMDSSIINENVVHLEISLFTLLRRLKLHESVAQRITSLLITDDLATIFTLNIKT